MCERAHIDQYVLSEFEAYAKIMRSIAKYRFPPIKLVPEISAA